MTHAVDIEPVLAGRAIVVTGAGQGLGRAFATTAAAAGALVVVNDLRPDAAETVADEIKASGGRAVAISADVSTEIGARTAVDGCVEVWGRIDGLVNNAAVIHYMLTGSSDVAQVEQMLRVNVLGSYLCGEAALRPMLAQGSGSIVNVTSGAMSGLKDMAAYSATKGAIVSLTYSWAADVAGTGVRVNAVSPFAMTQMTAELHEFHGTTAPPAPTPESNAPGVVYLLSDLAAGINGQVLRVADGRLGLVGPPAIRVPLIDANAMPLSVLADQLATVEPAPVGLTEITGSYHYLPFGSSS